MKPLISIIVPVYNAEKTLGRCLDSVLAQSVRNFEVILIDDGSRDGSGSLCDQYAESDSRIHAFHQENAGVSAARNKGIWNAVGEYLLFLDSDDELESNALRCYQEACENGHYDVVIGSLAVIACGSYTRKIGTDQRLSAGNEIWERICIDPSIFGYAGGKLVRTSIIQKENLSFNLHMRSQEDLDFFLSCYGCCTNFRMIPEPVYRYHYMPSSRTPPVGDFIANQLKILRIGGTRADLSEYAKNCVCKRILSLLYTGLYQASGQADYDEVVEKIASVEGLTELLAALEAQGEHGFVARNFAAGRYNQIQCYFKIRNRLRDVFRAIRGKKT